MLDESTLHLKYPRKYTDHHVLSANVHSSILNVLPRKRDFVVLVIVTREGNIFSQKVKTVFILCSSDMRRFCLLSLI